MCTWTQAVVRWHSNSYVLACDWLKLAPHHMTFQYDVVFKSRSDRRNLINHRSQTRLVYSLKSPLSSADFTIYAPGIGTLSYTVSSPLGEFSICALCCSYSQSLQFSFLVPPGTHHCWVDRGGVIWEACPTPLHMTVSAVMCYHCVKVAVGPHCHVCSTRRQA